MKKHYFLGFLLSFLMFFTLLSSALVMSATLGVVKENAISNLMKNDEVKSSIKDIAKDIINDTLKQNSNSSDNNNGTEEPTTEIPVVKNYHSLREIQLVSSDVLSGLPVEIPTSTEGLDPDSMSSIDLSGIITDEILDQIIDAVADTMASGNAEDMDLSGVKEEIIANTKKQAEQLVNDYIDEAMANGGVISIDKINESTVVKEFTEKNNITIDQATIDSLKEQYPEEINLNDTDVEKLKQDINTQLDESVMPELEKTVDDVVTEVEEELSKTVVEMSTSEESPIPKINAIVNEVAKILELLKLPLIGVSVVFLLLQFIVYRKRLYSPLINTGIVMLLCGAITYVISILPSLIPQVIDLVIDMLSSSAGTDLAPIVNSAISVALKPFGTVGITYIAIAVVLFVVAIIMKKAIYGKKDVECVA